MSPYVLFLPKWTNQSHCGCTGSSSALPLSDLDVTSSSQCQYRHFPWFPARFADWQICPLWFRCPPACVADRVMLTIWMERVGILVANKMYDAWKGQQDIKSGAANVPRQPGIALLLKWSEDFDTRNTSSFLWNMIKCLSWTRGDYRDKTGSDFSWQNKSLVSKHWDPSITIWQEGWRVHLDKPFVWRKDNRLIHPEWV